MKSVPNTAMRSEMLERVRQSRPLWVKGDSKRSEKCSVRSDFHEAERSKKKEIKVKKSLLRGASTKPF